MGLMDNKSPFLSRGVIGSAAAIGFGLVQMAGYVVTPADTAEGTSLLIGLGTSVAGIVALVGRVKARKRIAVKR